ncbi:hypothetical protein P152DRAFT_315563 [Eremomyces bilateralis CBS 781.70]|uniref:Uncharacterized protein n=1 Tax=Eremomyces bilateralis CBS 781.70 TaxID=1392243 RepID=A0A6G1G5Z3_9PEZI|nr:uncharacterized protein P152DRAFT_315563 [Eremomyces bilateralis CBS 781.70]KAF1813346.1 hypothetical protein P152DRAFT_315563 [Eremomyces bilateralis CBS 781.70]
MAVATAPYSFDPQQLRILSPDNFRNYSSPPMGQQPERRMPKSGCGANTTPDISSNGPWTDIDDILKGEGLAGPEHTQESLCEAFIGSCTDAAILIEDSESGTDSEDELPSLNALLSAGSRPETGGTPAADGFRDSSSSQAIESGEIPPSGKNGEPSTGVGMSRSSSDLSNYCTIDDDLSVADHTRLLFESLVQSTETAESGNQQPSGMASPRSRIGMTRLTEQTDGIADENHDLEINLSSLEQRKRNGSSSCTTHPPISVLRPTLDHNIR